MSPTHRRRAPRTHPPRRAPALVAVLLLALTLSACTNDTGDDTMKTANDTLVCGLLSPSLVHEVVPAGSVGTRGEGITSAAQRQQEPAACTVQDTSSSTTKIQVSVGEVPDPAAWRSKLLAEAKTASSVSRTYDGDPGVGYGSTYDSGVYVDGASVYVVRDDRLIRATVYHWASATPEERLALAEKMVLDLDRNVTEHDRAE